MVDFKELAFVDKLLFFKKKVISGFGLGLLLSFVVLSIILLYSGTFLNPFFQGFDGLSSHSSRTIISWPFQFSSSSDNIVNDVSFSINGSSSSDDGNEELSDSRSLNDTHQVNFSGNGKDLNFNGFGDGGVVLNSTHVGDFDGVVKSGSVGGTDKGGISEVSKNGSSVGVDGMVKNESFGNGVGGKIVGGTDKGEFSEVSKNGNSVGVDGGGNTASIEGGSLNVASNGGSVESIGVRNESSNVGSGVGSSGSNNRFYAGCDIFNGRWVRDDTKPYYPPGSCPHIDRSFDCHLNGRPDSDYVKWKWQPYGCDMPSLNATDFLERLRGKKLVFVGDSLNRNMWESLVCILRQSIHDKKRVYEISGMTKFKKKGFYAFRFEDYDCTVDFVGSPFLVRELIHNSKNGSYETLRLDLMDTTTSMYNDADMIIFNTGHWWTHEKTSKGEDYYQEGNHVYPRLKVLEAYKRALSTWGRWVDKNIDANRTQVFFRGYSGTHFRGGQWNSGGQCHNQSEPIYNDAYLSKYPTKMKVFEHVLKDMKTHVMYLNISRITDYRKDAHPSIYREHYRPNVQVPGDHVEDCSHWCLPGVPDTWNELLYASLLQSRRGSWG